MKHFVLAFIVCCTTFVSAQTAITLTAADMPMVNTTQRRAMDTLPLPAVNVGNPGTNQTYNFSNLVVYKYDTVQYRPVTNNQQSNFPNADVAITTDGVSFLFTRTNTGTNKFSAEGFQGPFAGANVTAQLSPVNVVYNFPAAYGNTATGSWGFQEIIPGSDLGLPALVSNVRVTYTATNWDTIDGWGKTVTPLGAYPSLRNVRKEYSRTIIETSTIFAPNTYSSQSDTRDTTIRYSYLAKESKGALVTLEYDSLDNLKDVIYSMTPPPAPTVSFTSTNGSAGQVSFTSTVGGYHDTYSWNFGDGSPTSNQTNPSHTYTANGAYNVCLTVFNGTVSTVVCSTVVVSNIVSAGNNKPIAVDDAYTVTQASSQIYHVATNDVDVDGDNICVTSVWGGQYATEYIGGTCDMILFAPDSSFTGNDTCYYSLCDDGTPVECDTAMVVFIVTADAALYPTASNDAVTILQPADTTVNVTANDAAGSTGNSFCITAINGSSNFTVSGCNNIVFNADSSFTGTDVVTYIICDNSLPTLCDTATLTVTVTPNAELLPVASFTPPFDCQATEWAYANNTLINTSTNSDSVSWNFTAINSQCQDSTETLLGDTIVFQFRNLLNSGCSFFQAELCVTAYNNFGSTTICDTICNISWLGINEISLSNISLYPNPTTGYITIDMNNNEDEITRNYATIEIYNVLGEKQKTFARTGNSKTANLNVIELPQGMYVATLLGASGERRVLGKFTKE